MAESLKSDVWICGSVHGDDDLDLHLDVVFLSDANANADVDGNAKPIQ